MLKIAKNPAILGAALALSLAGFSCAYAATKIGNDLTKCAGSTPAILVTVKGVKSSKGKVRVQLYPATKTAWLKKGAWIHRIELPAKSGDMKVCMPVPKSGSYGIAVRHDINANGKTDLSTDGGGMSNNPSINILNLGKPPVTKVAFSVGDGLKSISISMKYM
jgi:uncharacterized protein (DUF2141 family)